MSGMIQCKECRFEKTEECPLMWAKTNSFRIGVDEIDYSFSFQALKISGCSLGQAKEKEGEPFVASKAYGELYRTDPTLRTVINIIKHIDKRLLELENPFFRIFKKVKN